MRCIRTRRWKYIHRFYERPTPIQPNQAPCASRDVWDQHGWAEREQPREELYDLVFDPGESDNLAADEEHATTRAELKGRLRAWMEKTDDPLLDGHIPLTDGGSIVTWDQESNHGKSMNAGEWNAWLEANDEFVGLEGGEASGQ
jgi:hypothetical protein